MQHISQEHPQVRVGLAQIAEGYSGELLISCLDISRIGYLYSDMPPLRQSVEKLRR
jgi:hypothetical protein